MIFISKEKGNKKLKQNIILGILIIVLVTGFALYNKMNEKEPVDYFRVTGLRSEENGVIEEYRILKKIVTESKLKDDMVNSITFGKENILEYFDKEYFENKKLAMIVLYEDDSKDYLYTIDDVVYNEARTDVTIEYTYKHDGYAGTLDTAWYNYIFIELDSTVENVEFVHKNK